MKKLLFLLIFFWPIAVFTQEIFLNVNVLLNPTDGLPPSYMRSPTSTNLITAQNEAIAFIDARLDTANAILCKYSRGLKFQRASVNFINGIAAEQHYLSGDNENFQDAAEDDPIAYNWSFTEINYYFNDGPGTAQCSFPAGPFTLNPLNIRSDKIIVQRAEGGITTLLHEIGHFFNLCHTHGCLCADNITEPIICGTGGDRVDDTIIDKWDWDKNQISQNNYFGLNYNELSQQLKNNVDNVFYNVMSYHSTRIRFTPLQLDRWQSAIRDHRSFVTKTIPHFVKKDNGCPLLDPCTGGPNNDEFPKIHSGDDNAYDNGLDSEHKLLILRPATYDEGAILWNKECLIVSDGTGSSIIK